VSGEEDPDLSLLRREPPAGFTERVMSQIATRPLPRASLWQRLWRPRTITLRPGPLLGGAALAAAMLLALWLRAPAQPPVVQRPIVQPPVVQPVISASVVESPVRVRFVLSAPAAREVSVTGDFNGWRADAAPAERGADGVWRVTLPLSPGSWSYSFVVDGKFVEDPLAQIWREDGFGGRNAIVRVD
jgi:Carbohydrate-binding module 48 (Isoamylase N-terminal domain)